MKLKVIKSGLQVRNLRLRTLKLRSKWRVWESFGTGWLGWRGKVSKIMIRMIMFQAMMKLSITAIMTKMRMRKMLRSRKNLNRSSTSDLRSRMRTSSRGTPGQSRIHWGRTKIREIGEEKMLRREKSEKRRWKRKNWKCWKTWKRKRLWKNLRS